MVSVKKKGYLETGKVMFINIGEILPNPGQPRKVFDPAGLEELAASIVQFGIIQPLTVRKKGETYELVAGERRLRAAKMAGLSEVPCIQIMVDEAQSGMIAMVENLQRRDLDYIEEAEGLARLMRLYGLSQEQAAMRVGKSQSAVANKLRLLRHSPHILQRLRRNKLSERHARALLRLQSDAERGAALDHIIENQLNVAQTDRYIDALVNARLAEERQDRKEKRGRVFIVKDIRLFLNTIDHNLEIMKNAGIEADCGKSETPDRIVLTITIRKKTTNSIQA